MKLFFSLGIVLLLISCKKDEVPNDPQLVVRLQFDSTLMRLDNFGNPSVIPSNHSAQSPVFNSMSAHYVELAPTAYTPLGSGEILYHGIETTAGGSNAVNFDKALITTNNQVMFTVPLSFVSAGTYEYVRVSLTYQNYNIKVKSGGVVYSGQLGSFVGFNNYITTYQLNGQTIAVNANRLQGYWGFETQGYIFEGQSAGTTVPNPIASTSPVPPGSCVVTGSFPTPLVITGNETKDIVVYLKLSTNKSFEWEDQNMDGFYEPAAGDVVVDMGLRGLFPTYVK